MDTLEILDLHRTLQKTPNIIVEDLQDEESQENGSSILN